MNSSNTAAPTNIRDINKEIRITKRMNPFSWTLNSWYIFFQVLSLFLLAGTVGTGAGALITGYVINRRQSKVIEELEIKRLQLEQSVSPRQLGILLNAPTGTNFDSLKPFSGIQVLVRVLPEVEAGRAASDLVGVMQMAGWNPISIERSAELNIPFWDGVVIEPHSMGEKEMNEVLNAKTPQEKQDLREKYEGDQERCRKAADALVEFLTSNNWVARTFPAIDMPANTIRVNIGFKKTPYLELEQKLPKDFRGQYWHGNTFRNGMPFLPPQQAPPPKPTQPKP